MHKVIANIERPDKSIIERFRKVAVEVVVQQLGSCQIMDSAIKPLCLENRSFVGPAVTVLLDATDVMMTIASLDVAQAGDIIVVAAQGDTHASSWGGGLTLSAEHIGVEGVVVDGVVHDVGPILRREVPVFCRGGHLLHGTGNTPGSINVPASCGKVPVSPGDIVIGDPGGVVVVPKERALEVLEAAERKTEFIKQVGAELMSKQSTLSEHRNQRKLVEAAGVLWID